MKPQCLMLAAFAVLACLECDSADAPEAQGQRASSTTTGGREPCPPGAVLCSGRCVERTAPECETACRTDSVCSDTGAAGAGGALEEPDPVSDACAFEVTATSSPAIATVGVVEWATDLADVEEAVIEFGLDADYGSVAPVDLAAPGHRTLLLGMKPERTYHFRIKARSGNRVCTSEDRTLTSGPGQSDLPSFEVTTHAPERVSPGFLITTQYNGSRAVIADSDGDIVWWFPVGSNVTSARMSFDGKHMWVNTSNVPEGTARVLKVSMDGLEVEDLSAVFAGQNHQLAPLPDGSVAFYAYGDNGCDDVKEYHPTRGVRHIINAARAHGGEGRCHLNVIEYSAEDDTLVFSDLMHHNYTKVTRTGEVVWVLGGATSDFSGSGATWTRQHGIHLLDPYRLVLFSNGAIGDAGAVAIELELDLGSLTATRVWEYTQQGLSTSILGDVQRMENDNTLIVYSGSGIVHEVTAQNQLVQEIHWDSGGALGYAMKRPSLYGPPPK